ncbi:MAG: hypothetical protein WDM76_09815 [Limisphaerales bacterium]
MTAVPLNPGIIATDMLRSTFGGSATKLSHPARLGQNRRAISVKNQFCRQWEAIVCARPLMLGVGLDSGGHKQLKQPPLP